MINRSSKLASTLAIAALAVSSLIAPAASATPTPIALDPASKLATWACDPTIIGLGNIDFATLEFTKSTGSGNTCDTSNGYFTTAFNPLDAYVYSIDYYNPILSRVDVTGSPVDFSSGRFISITGTTTNATVLAINPRTGAAFVADDTKLYSLDLTTGVASSPVTIGFALYRMAYSPNGTLYATDSNGKLMSVNLATGATTDVVELRSTCGNNRPKGIAFDAAGTLFFIDIDGVVCSAKVSNFAATVARFNSNNPAANNVVWAGDPSTPITGGPIVITYGNLSVVFNVNGGRALSPNKSPFYGQIILDTLGQTNSSITLPTPTRSGYTFNGWFDAATGGTKIGDGGSSYLPSANANIQMYAQWTRDSSSSELANTGSNMLPVGIAGTLMVAAGIAALATRRRKTN